ncbi:hypothetical protein [Microbulbifer mangrovi]|uniref:hypothetical protein n=1 Tax=Microbulbifer mangrovi TaxID=927787 RepID=UPI0009905952|nr:hypothetical protein [Microbulbifer mangrovi]
MRKVILHYHLFKNAGSSIDSILHSSFGDKWINIDKENAWDKILPAEVSKYIDSNPAALAISSHQFMPPLPAGKFEVFPVVFLRHPILRARSAYMFEWKNQLGLSEPKGSFVDYVLDKLAPGVRGPISDFQVLRLSNTAYNGDGPKYSPELESRLGRAKGFISELPFFGLVEHFQESLERMHFYLQYHFPNLRVVNREVNASQGSEAGVEEKLFSIRRELGETLYGQLCERNRFDLELYNFAQAMFWSVVPKEA